MEEIELRRSGRVSRSSDVGEHHRPDYAISSPAVVLAGGA
jgi:hypothetical protein